MQVSGRSPKNRDCSTVPNLKSQDDGLDAFTFHGLRHYYASLLIRHGESVKTAQARLGHASAVETLDNYSHLCPDIDEPARPWILFWVLRTR